MFLKILADFIKKNRPFFLLFEKRCYFCNRIWGQSSAEFLKRIVHAKIAQVVEHNLAKVRVAGSSPVFRSLLNAKVAQLVEHDLPKVGVAGSSPVFRSLERTKNWCVFFISNFTE